MIIQVATSFPASKDNTMPARDYEMPGDDNMQDGYLEEYTSEREPGGLPACPACGYPERTCMCDPYERTHD